MQGTIPAWTGLRVRDRGVSGLKTPFISANGGDGSVVFGKGRVFVQWWQPPMVAGGGLWCPLCCRRRKTAVSKKLKA